jgi:hypothetical protein
MKLHDKYGQSLKFGATVEVLERCYPFKKEVMASINFFIPKIKKQDDK